jgi:hypothetical protein
VTLAVASAAFADDLETRRAAFDGQLDLFQVPFEKEVEQLKDNYRGALEKLQVKIQKRGDLDQVLKVKDELKRLDASPENGAGKDSPVPELAALQTTYADSMAKLEAELQGKQSHVLRLHLKGLAALQHTLTTEGKIDEAVAVRKEIETLEKTPLGELAARAAAQSKDALIPLDYSLYYSFDEKQKDRRVLDKSRNKFHGKSEKNGWIESGKRGGGFDGTIADTIKIAHDPKFVSESFTIAGWVNLKRPISHGRIWDKFNQGQKTGYSLNVHELKPELELWGADGEHYRITIEGKLQPDEWRHLAVAFQPGKSLLYIDGELAAEKEMPEAIRPDTGEVRIGREGRGILGGYLDELMFYSRVLSPEEVGHVMVATGKER